MLLIDSLIPFQDDTVLSPGTLQTPAKKPVQGWKPGSPPDIQGASLSTPYANSLETTPWRFYWHLLYLQTEHYCSLYTGGETEAQGG